jgi:multisubunit Na+/H+ antiporter MnhG subunit
MHHWIIAGVLVAVAVALAIICSVGLAIVTTTLERLHFSATVTSFSAALITAAVWIDDPTWQSRLKVLLTAIVLFVMNSILSHSTARAIRIRQEKHFEPRPGDEIGVITKENPTGAQQ